MTRIFIQNDIGDKEYFTLDREDSHYLISVLRMRPGEELIIVDGPGKENLAQIDNANKEGVMVRITERRDCLSEREGKIVLYQSVSKGERMDLTIQKSVELGVTKIVPVFSGRCVVKPSKDGKKTDRWQKIALEAARQSGRGFVPEVTEPMSFSEAVEDSGSRKLVLFPWEEEHGTTLKQALEGKDLSDIGFFIGPEGGFSEEEAEEASKAGARKVTIGKRILRTETAGPAVLAMLLYHTEL